MVVGELARSTCSSSVKTHESCLRIALKHEGAGAETVREKHNRNKQYHVLIYKPSRPCQQLSWQRVTWRTEWEMSGLFTAWHSAESHQRGFQFWSGLIACRYRGSSSRQSHRERLMYSPVAEGFNTGAAIQDNALCLNAYWGSASIPVHVWFWTHRHND